MLQEVAAERVKTNTSVHSNDYKWRSVGRGLTTFTENLAHMSYCCETDLRILDFLEEVDLWIEKRDKVDVQASSERIELLRSWIQGTQSRIAFLDKRTEAQVQTLHSLISQRDNAVSIQLAEASKTTAEASLRDNQSLKQLAEDSKNIAAATQKDSAAMRTIAIVTIIFLPGTFTATLFSADFFNLQPTGDTVVSKWIWAYAGITLGLTAGVLISYYIPMRRRTQEIDRLVGEGSKEKAS